MNWQKLPRLLAFAVTGGMLLQTTGCDQASLLETLTSTLAPLVIQLLLSGIAT